MHHLRWTAICVAMLAMLSKAEAQPLCAMTEQQAAQSPLCMRWYFACKSNPSAKPATTPPPAVDYGWRRRLLIYGAFYGAQEKCETFSYQEALAAMQTLLLMDTTTSSSR